MSRTIGSRAVRTLVVAAMCALPVQSFALTVTTNDIADGAVTAPKLGIVCPDGQYLKYTVGSGWACNVGTPGPQGPQGVAGPQGSQGVKGDTGLTGPAGPAGPQGLQGLTGDVGPQGPQGLKGDIGATGPMGPMGLTGPAGPQGLAGLQGVAGPEGPIGPAGPQGPVAQYANVIVVAKSGGDQTDIQAAIDSANPTAENPVLIKVMPGIYDITSSNGIVMKDYVTIEGAGRELTKIVDPRLGVFSIIPKNNNKFSNITIESRSIGLGTINTATNNLTFDKVDLKVNACSPYQCTGLRIQNSASVEVNDSNIIVTGGDSGFGITNINSDLKAYKTNIVSTGALKLNYGITASNCTGSEHNTVLLKDVSVVSDGPTDPFYYGYDISAVAICAKGTIIDSEITSNNGNSIGIFAAYNSNTEFANTKIVAPRPLVKYGQTIKCINLYDGNYQAISCQ